MNKKPSKVPLSNLLNLIPYLRPYKVEIFLVIIALLITSTMILLMGKAVKYLIDMGFSSGNYLNLLLSGFLLAIIILAIAGYYRSSLINSVGEKVVADLRSAVYRHIIKVSAQFFEITKTGDVISRLTVDAALLYNIISNSISFALRNILLFGGGIIFLFFTSAKLTLVALAVIPLAIAPIFIIGKKIKNLSLKSQELLGIVGSHIEESINGIKTIQAYLCEEKEIRNFNHLVKQSLAISLQKIKARSMLISLVILCAFGSVLAVFWFGGNEVLKGRMSPGELSSFIFYAIITATALVSISQVAGQLQTAAGATERLFELLRITSPVTEIEHPEHIINPQRLNIKFVDLAFAYPSRNLVLKDFNLTIAPGQKIALVGPSGSGKSTILQLLMRFYDVNQGEILINNHNIKDLFLKELRGLFSYISQDCFIFSGTVFENIAYIDKNITVAEVQKIINDNEALNFINNLPQKLHSTVGEKGIKLSGGERQRIAIARAIIKNAPIILLDEATSALDNKNEQAISKAIEHLMQNRTIITIAHRLSSIVNADLIIFLKDGKIAESGTHRELIAHDGLYKKMYEAEDLGLLS